MDKFEDGRLYDKSWEEEQCQSAVSTKTWNDLLWAGKWYQHDDDAEATQKVNLINILLIISAYASTMVSSSTPGRNWDFRHTPGYTFEFECSSIFTYLCNSYQVFSV